MLLAALCDICVQSLFPLVTSVIGKERTDLSGFGMSSVDPFRSNVRGV
jgi:hypothetical protein